MNIDWNMTSKEASAVLCDLWVGCFGDDMQPLGRCKTPCV